MAAPALREELRALRQARRLAAARELIRAQPQFADSVELQALLHEHEDFWWQPLEGRRVVLERRDADDASFVRACWSDRQFMGNFNRSARPLPESDAALRQVLERERAALLSELHALHWTVRTEQGPVGFVSATDHSAVHRRCEFLIGFPALQRAIAVQAAQLAIGFLRDRMGVERLTAHFYPENIHAIRAAEKFGFVQEGVLKGFLRNADGTRADLVIAGLQLTQPYRAESWRAAKQRAG
ncbi:MAG TPA: GNAT family N-acetyltransferase [Ramlibacter sp.]|uniref:GNAT family N-acetyltransferase n=1 Tax=Ramlibacter sp. TaxID=1917967 RepID=UPI002ED41820